VSTVHSLHVSKTLPALLTTCLPCNSTRLRHRLREAENKSSEIESEQSKLRKELDKACGREKVFEDEVWRASKRLEISEQIILALHKDFRTMEARPKKDLGNMLALAERKLQQG
jgi:uncharacterized protein (DUF3084 family)